MLSLAPLLTLLYYLSFFSSNMRADIIKILLKRVYEVFFLEKKLDWFSHIISLMLFRNSWCNLYISWFLLDIRFSFACCESNLYWNVERFQNFITGTVWKFFPLLFCTYCSSKKKVPLKTAVLFKCEIFYILISDPNHTWEIVVSENCWI